MAVRLTIETRNLRGLVANLFAADARMQAATRQTVRKWGPKQQQLTKELAPYDESKPADAFHMRDHVRLRYSKSGLVYATGFEGKDFSEADEDEYFVFTEFGTRKMEARPCVFPARDQIYPQFKADLSANVKAAVRRKK